MAQDQGRPATPEEIIRVLAKRAGVPPDLAVAIARKESNLTHDPKKVGPAGEIGIFQLTPPATKQMGVSDPTDLLQNIQGGIGYIKRLTDMYDGDVRRALMAYNGGEGNVARDTVSDAAKAYADTVIGDLVSMAKARPAKAAAALVAPAAAAPAPAASTAGPGGLIESLFSPVPAVQRAMRSLASKIDQRPAVEEAPVESRPGEGFIDRTGRSLLEAVGAPGLAENRAARIAGAAAAVPVGLVSSAAQLPGALAGVLQAAFERPARGGAPGNLQASGPDPAAETAKGLLAGAAQIAGDATPLDVLLPLLGRFGRTAKAGSEAPASVKRMLEGFDSQGRQGFLVRKADPTPTGLPGGAASVDPSTSALFKAVREALDEIPAEGTSERAAFISGRRPANYLPPSEAAPRPRLSSQFAPGADPGTPPGNVTFVEDSVERALQALRNSQKAKEAEAAEGAVDVDAMHAKSLSDLIGAAIRNRNAAAREAGVTTPGGAAAQIQDTIRAITGDAGPRTPSLDAQRRLAAAAGHRADVPPLDDPAAFARPVEGTIATNRGPIANESRVASSINPALNPEGAAAVRARGMMPPAAGKVTKVDPAVPKVRPEKTKPLPAGRPAAQATDDEVASAVLDMFQKGELEGVTADDIAAMDIAKIREQYGTELSARIARKTPAVKAAASAPAKRSVLDYERMTEEELIKRRASKNQRISAAADAEIARRAAAAAPAPAPAPAPAVSGFTNAPRVVAPAVEAAPPAAVAPVKPPAAAAPAPAPVAAPARPAAPVNLETTVAAAPPVQRVPLGATGGGPIGAPRTEPTVSRTRSAGDIAPGKTVKETLTAESAAGGPALTGVQHTDAYNALKAGSIKATLVEAPPAKAPTQLKKFKENGYAVEKHPAWGEGNRTFIAGKTQTDLDEAKTAMQRSGRWPGEPAPVSPIPEVAKAVDQIAAAPAEAPKVMRRTRAAQVAKAVKAKTPEEAAAAIAPVVPPESKAIPKEAITAAVDEMSELRRGIDDYNQRQVAGLKAEGAELREKIDAAMREGRIPKDMGFRNREAARLKAQRAETRNYGPPPTGVDPTDWRAINVAAKTARKLIGEGVTDVRLVHAMQNFWGAEETARRLGWKGKEGAKRVRDLTGQKGRVPDIATMAKEHEARMRSLARDPEGFIRTEALIAGFGFAAGGLAGATIGGEDVEDRAASAIFGALLGAAGAHKAAAALSRGVKVPQALKELPESLAALDTANLLTGPAIIKATMGSMGGVSAGIMQRLGEGRLADVRRGIAHVATTAPKTYIKTLLKSPAELEKEAAMYSARGQQQMKTAVGRFGQQVLSNIPIRAMSAADAAGVSVLRKMGFSQDEASRLMLVGEPTSWRGQAIVKMINTDFRLRLLVKFPRVGVNIIERSIEYTPGLNRLVSVRSGRAEAARAGFSGFKKQDELSGRTLNAMGAVGAAAFAGGYLWGNYADPTPYQAALFTTVAGPASGLAAAGVAAGKARRRGRPGVAEAAQSLVSSVPKIDEQTVRFLSPSKRFEPGGPFKRLIEQASGASAPGNPYSRR